MLKLILQYSQTKKRHFCRYQVQGRRHRRWFSNKTKDAEEELKQFKQNILDGKMPLTSVFSTQCQTNDGKKDMRVEELAHQHLEWFKANRAEGTYLDRRHYIKVFVKYVCAIMVSQITRKTLEDYFIWAKHGHGKSRNSGNEHMRHVKSMLLWREEMEMIDNPVRKFPPMRTQPSETKRFTDDEVKTLLSHAPADFKDMLLFGLLTGLRPYELRTLRREHIRSDDQGYSVVIEHHKTSASARLPQPRSVPLCDEAGQILVRQFQTHPESQEIFLNTEGKPYSASVFYQRLQRLCKRTKVHPRPPYALRHTFATSAAENKTNITILGQLMGHTTPRTTQRYIENNSDYHRTVVDELALRFAEQAPHGKTEKVATKVATKGISDAVAEITNCVNSGKKAS